MYLISGIMIIERKNLTAVFKMFVQHPDEKVFMRGMTEGAFRLHGQG